MPNDANIVTENFDTSRSIYKTQTIVLADVCRNISKTRTLDADIFQDNARLEHVDEGIRFYEQDVVMLRYVYDGDITIETRVKYSLPGFGIVINAYNDRKTIDDRPTRGILFKIGNNSLSTYKQEFGKLDRVQNVSCTIAPDDKWHLLRFKKTGVYIYLYDVKDNNEELIGYYKSVQDDFSQFRVGLYSNKNNIVSSFDIYDNRPEFWFANIINTNGGRVSFARDEILVEQAEKDIEIEQECISLAKGRYFLSYKKSPADKKLQMDLYLFDSIEDKIHAPEKTLLRYDKKQYGDVPYFDITNDNQKVNLLIQANSGYIDNIAIKDDPKQDYISTEDKPKTKDGSWLVLYTNKIQKAEITANVLAVPSFKIDEKNSYSIYTYNKVEHTITDLHINENQEYKYTFTLKDNGWEVVIKAGNNRTIYQSLEPLNKGDITFFKNISGYISRLVITERSGRAVDILNQRTSKKYVPASITSPIIVTDKNYIPFDLSASYRLLDNSNYVFTNWEREVFNPSENLSLASQTNGDGNIIIYGIKDELNLDNIYRIRDAQVINDIDYASKSYDILSNDVYTIIENQEIHIDRNIIGNYTAFVVDYLKLNSYAINLTDDGNEYEVEISTTQDKSVVMYDMTDAGEIRTYKILNELSPADDTYIVLKKDEEV